jgi:hypothetical protein
MRGSDPRSRTSTALVAARRLPPTVNCSARPAHRPSPQPSFPPAFCALPTFQLTPAAFLNAVDYSVCIARWSAERGGTKIDGNDLAVYRFERGKIADVWFYDDGYDPEVFKRVFAFA